MSDTETANQADGTDTSAEDTAAVDTGADTEHQTDDTPELDEDGNPIEQSDEAEADDLEEIERDGKKAKIPAWLKPELMMQADYTRKTQELAEARKAFEAERTQVQQSTQEERNVELHVAVIDNQIANYAKVDWNAWQEADPFGAQRAFNQYQLLKDAKAQAQGYLGSLQQQRTAKEQQETATRLEQAAATVAREIKDWSPQTAAKLLDYGRNHYGFSPQELDGIDDPRLIKVLHAAVQWEEHQKKQKAGQRHQAAQTAKPAAKVGASSAPKQGLDDRLSPDEWVRRRNEQLAKKRAAR